MLCSSEVFSYHLHTIFFSFIKCCCAKVRHYSVVRPLNIYKHIHLPLIHGHWCMVALYFSFKLAVCMLDFNGHFKTCTRHFCNKKRRRRRKILMSMPSAPHSLAACAKNNMFSGGIIMLLVGYLLHLVAAGCMCAYFLQSRAHAAY